MTVYFFILLFYGAQGVFAYRDMLQFEQRLSENIARMTEKNRTLRAKADDQLRHSEVVRMEARRLNYYAGNEKVIAVTHNEENVKSYQNATFLIYTSQYGERSLFYRVLAVVMAIFVFAVLTLLAPPIDRKYDRRYYFTKERNRNAFHHIQNIRR